MALPTASQLWAIVAILGITAASVFYAKVEIVGPGKGTRMISNGIFWISLAVVVASVAYIYRTAKQAAP